MMNFPNSPSVNDTYQFNNLVFVYDGTKWKVDGQLSYIQDAIQFVRSGTQADRPTVNAAALYYNTDLEGLEFYYPEIDTWEVVSTFAKQVDPTSDSGQIAYTSPGTYSFVCPANVFQVHVVCVGGGGGGFASNSGGSGGGGGGLAWRNNIPVIPGQSYTVSVGSAGFTTIGAPPAGGNSFFIDTTTVAGFGGGGAAGGAAQSSTGAGGNGGGFFTAANGTGGGGFGGIGGRNTITNGSAGGGGAAGYTGNGGAGGSYNQSGASGSGGGGGGGGSGIQLSSNSGAGGGVGLLGQGLNGGGGAFGGTGTRGGGGSGGEGGGQLVPGGAYGGGGAGSDITTVLQHGASGAVRIIWGPNRAFPSTNTGDV